VRTAIVTWTGAWALALAVWALPVGAEQTAAASKEPSKATKPAADHPPDKPKPVVIVGASPEDGFVIRSENGSFKLQLKALLQFDGRFFLSDSAEALTDNFVLRRARPILQGTVARYFDFNLTPDFGGITTTIQDAWVDAKASAAASLRLGKQKPPIGVEHLQGDAYVAFIERALPSGLVPNRDVGAQLHGDLKKGVLSYSAAVFDGTPDGASVVFTVRVTDLEANKGRSDVWLAPTGGGGARRLTSHEASDTQARWAPDGKGLYFLTSRTGTSQVFRLSLEGGEPQAVTGLPLDVDALEVAPGQVTRECGPVRRRSAADRRASARRSLRTGEEGSHRHLEPPRN